MDVLYFYTIGDYRLIIWTCWIVPCTINLLMIIFFVKETPFFLLSRYSTKKALKAINRIGFINKG